MAAEWELHGVGDCEVVDADHAGADAVNEVFNISGRGAEYAGAEGVRGGVCEREGVGDGRGGHEDAYWGEEFFLGDAHWGGDVDEEGGGEVVTVWEFRV